MNNFLLVDGDEDTYTYMPMNTFTTVDLGCERGNNLTNMITRMENPASKEFLHMFDSVWNDEEKLTDVTEEVINMISSVYQENSPELIYFMSLYNIFSEFLEDISEDVLPNEATGFKDSVIWNKLFHFQKDAALALFPNAVTETKDENGNVVRAIDADVLRQEISATVVEGSQERYQFTWPDKKKSVVLANQPIAKTLRLDREKSVGRDGTPGSIDKKGRKVDSSLKRGSDESDDISAYDLILKNKERLLSFENPVRFIFSHSALREGWDNPNVFQICTLKHGGSSPTQKRQEVGRGLRLCVNQNGERQDYGTLGSQVQEINLLTVIASDGYKDFVADLQKGIREDLYDRPTTATAEYFIGKTLSIGDSDVTVSDKQGRDIYRYLIKNDYIDEDDHVTDEIVNNT